MEYEMRITGVSIPNAIEINTNVYITVSICKLHPQNVTLKSLDVQKREEAWL